jgi:hypothetical protein
MEIGTAWGKELATRVSSGVRHDARPYDDGCYSRRKPVYADHGSVFRTC